MPPIKIARRERFAQLVFEGVPLHHAVSQAGYSPKSAQSAAYRMMRDPNVIARISELHEQSATDRVLSVAQRKQILSEIASGCASDYQVQGQDGVWTNYGPESPNPRSVRKMVSRTDYDKDGNTTSVTTGIELDDRKGAIAELNKMEGVYPAAKVEHTIGLSADDIAKLRREIHGN